MKKIFVILYGVCLLFLFGCVDHTAKKSQSDIEIRQRQCNILAVENKKIDYNKFIKEICGCDWDGTRRGEIAVDGVTHYWDIYDTSFIYYNDKILMDIDDKTARKISEDILSALDIDEWSGILKTKEYTYIGEFKNNKVNGIGIRIYSSSHYYIGMFKNNEYSGKGLLIENKDITYKKY